MIKINASKATLAYVDFDGVTALPALSTMTEVLYTRYVTLFKVSMTHESQYELLALVLERWKFYWFYIGVRNYSRVFVQPKVRLFVLNKFQWTVGFEPTVHWNFDLFFCSMLHAKICFIYIYYIHKRVCMAYLNIRQIVSVKHFDSVWVSLLICKCNKLGIM